VVDCSGVAVEVARARAPDEDGEESIYDIRWRRTLSLSGPAHMNNGLVVPGGGTYSRQREERRRP